MYIYTPCMHIYIYICMCMCIYLNIYTYINTNTYVYMHTVYLKKKVEKNLPQIHRISHQLNLECFLFFGACPVPYSIYLGLIIHMNSEYASHIMSSLLFLLGQGSFFIFIFTFFHSITEHGQNQQIT